MAKNNNSSQGEELFARAAYDQLKDTEEGLSVEIVLEVEKTYRKGVFLFSMTVWDLNGGGRTRKLAKLSKEWPGSSAMSIGAHLFQMSNSVATLAENAHFSVYGIGDPPA